MAVAPAMKPCAVMVGRLALKPFARVSQEARLLVWFVRGNHETRGQLARQLRDYVTLPDGRYYGAMNEVWKKANVTLMMGAHLRTLSGQLGFARQPHAHEVPSGGQPPFREDAGQGQQGRYR